MPRIRRYNASNALDAAISAEVAVATRALSKVLGMLSDARRATEVGDWDARSALAKSRRDAEQCISMLRSFRSTTRVVDVPMVADKGDE
jgi:hypothetical protein